MDDCKIWIGEDEKICAKVQRALFDLGVVWVTVTEANEKIVKHTHAAYLVARSDHIKWGDNKSQYDECVLPPRSPQCLFDLVRLNKSEAPSVVGDGATDDAIAIQATIDAKGDMRIKNFGTGMVCDGPCRGDCTQPDEGLAAVPPTHIAASLHDEIVQGLHYVIDVINEENEKLKETIKMLKNEPVNNDLSIVSPMDRYRL